MNSNTQDTQSTSEGSTIKNERVMCPVENCGTSFKATKHLYDHLRRQNLHGWGDDQIRELKRRKLDKTKEEKNAVLGIVAPEDPDVRVREWIAGVHCSHPLFNHGLEILRDLGRMDVEEIPLIANEWDELFDFKPTLTNVLEDLLADSAPRFSNMVTNTMEEDVTTAEFIAGYINAADSSVPYQREIAPPVNAIGFSATPKGLLRSKPSKFRNLDDSPLEYMRSEHSPMLEWQTVLTPAGGLTGVHIDSVIVGQANMSLWGNKLWFLWPPTSANLQWFSAHQHRNRGHDVLEAMKNLNGLKVSNLRCGQAIYLPPGTLHAVLTISNSCHTGCSLVKEAEWSETKRVWNWELQLLEHRHLTIAKEEVARMKVEVNLWGHLFLGNNQKEKEIEEQKNEMKALLDSFKPKIVHESDSNSEYNDDK
jgi:hypothetical protein